MTRWRPIDVRDPRAWRTLSARRLAIIERTGLLAHAALVLRELAAHIARFQDELERAAILVEDDAARLTDYSLRRERRRAA